MLHFESIDELHNLDLLDNLRTRLLTDATWHLKLLNLVKPLVYFSCLVHEVFQLVDVEHMDLFDALPY